MTLPRRTLLIFTMIAAVLFGCRSWSSAPGMLPAPADSPPAATPFLPAQLVTPTPVDLGSAPLPEPAIGGAAELTVGGAAELVGPVLLGDPAGCLPAESQAELASARDMLAYADQLIALDRSLKERLYLGTWNAYAQVYDYNEDHALSIAVNDVKNEYLIQRMLNALQVAGFVVWLRGSDRPEQDLHILAVPLLDPAWREGKWAPYIEAFWQAPLSIPPGDLQVRPALKLSPCDWMVSGGFAPAVDAGWWATGSTGWPDYASAATAYLAADTYQANQVARRIDWLGSQLEAANTMCGPLVWSILHDAGAFPPGIGAWSAGSRVFWLAKPTSNGRPWSLFPPGTYRVYHFDSPLSTFNFKNWPLYPGDFLYTYSEKDGFDHMLLVTEVHPDGSVYTVTNLVKEGEQPQVTIERALLVQPNDPTAGLVRNEWRDRLNGRTGHAGFDVFRWDWMEKDIAGVPVDYTVQPGDTLGLIALRWKTPAELIAQYNALPPGASLSAGQALRIPPNPVP